MAHDSVAVYRDEAASGNNGFSAIVTAAVPQGLDDEYVAWQKKISDTEAGFTGFLGHRVQRPVAGARHEWVVVVSFDTEAHLSAWLDSSERAALLAEGERFNRQLEVTKTSFGFDFWSQRPDAAGTAARASVGKQNLLVLMALYPIVFLWGYFVSTPLLDGPREIPFWLSLFVGNLVSTQLLGWWVMPWVFKRFDWWLKPRQGARTQLLGFTILAVVYAASMALYAWLLSLVAA
ncbi:Antibiotic biosynthesis monooxygenase (ABM) superfamily enzyme [Agreia bicolorata]|uniref:Antibiotic biosynthesis monooxygenase (ABM) superfamily enzyme n=1 Tax=Agreia bicolorata TaxID=110935 RepID=A0A1T4WZP0_9MICO|nr:antibiotic biosynthesis monooxygenase [Agreia bicolorata]SKA82335.1 Antibiotic biosynthesis monooxygenase (ABM) superfamily enzyme [Agreia bicolorata]